MIDDLEQLTQDAAQKLQPGDLVYYRVTFSFVKPGQKLSPQEQLDLATETSLNNYLEDAKGVDLLKTEDPALTDEHPFTVKEVRGGPYTFPWREWHGEADRTFNYTGFLLEEVPVPAMHQELLKNGFSPDVLYVRKDKVPE